MADASRGTPVVFFLFPRSLTLSTFHISVITLYVFSLKNPKTSHTQKVSLSLGPRDFILPRPVCSRPPDLVTSKNPPCSKEKQNITSRRPRRCARTPEIFSNHPSRGRSDLRVLSVIRIKEDERSLPRYHISRLAFGGLEHLHNLRRPCRHQRRAPVVTRLVHISSTGKQDSNMRGSIAPARGEEGSQPILVRGVDLE